jgi:hypothetical protein
MQDRLSKNTSASPALPSGDVDADWESADAVGDEAPGATTPLPIRMSSTTSAAHSASNTTTTKSFRAEPRSRIAIAIAGSSIPASKDDDEDTEL